MCLYKLFLCIFHDREEINELEYELEQSQRRKEILVQQRDKLRCVYLCKHDQVFCIYFKF